MSSAPVMKIGPDTPDTPEQGADTPRASAAWAPLSEAATKLDCHKDHLRRRCRDFLEPRGVARILLAEENGQPCWHLRRDWDLRLNKSKLGRDQQIPKAELANYSQAQRDRAWERAASVKRLRELKRVENRPQPQWLPKLVRELAAKYPRLKLGERSLKQWDRKYQQPADILKLIDTRGGNQKAGADPACWDYFRSIYLDERRPSLKSCWERTREYAQVHDLTWTSLKQCERQLDDKISVEMQAQWRKPDEYRSKFAPYLPQDPDAWAARTLWQGDHAQLDFMVKHPTTGKPVRPWVSVWLGWRSRRVAGYCLSLNPDSSTILAALRHGLLHQRDANMGGPDAVWIDNGKDYDSYTFKGQTKAERQQVQKTVEGFRVDEARTEGIFNLLDIEPHFSIPHNPNGKSRVERWFGTLHGQFDKSFSTYCGSHHGDRPENLQNILKDSRNLPDFEHVRQRLAEFIAGYNASADHDRKDMLGWSPDDAIQAWAPNRRAYASDEALDHCLQVWHQPKMVGKNGVTIQVGGATLGFGYTNHDLRMLKGRRDAKVKIAYDPWDLSKVRVYHEDGRFITEAHANPIGGGQSAVTKQQVAQAQRERNRYRTKRREVAQNAHHEYLSTREIAQREANSANRQGADDKPLKLVQTPLDEAAQDHQRLQQIEAREPINLADATGDSADSEGEGESIYGDDPVLGLQALHAKRHGFDNDDLEMIDLASYPLNNQDEDDDSSHLLDQLGQEGGAA